MASAKTTSSATNKHHYLYAFLHDPQGARWYSFEMREQSTPYSENDRLREIVKHIGYDGEELELQLRKAQQTGELPDEEDIELTVQELTPEEGEVLKKWFFAGILRGFDEFGCYQPVVEGDGFIRVQS